MDGGDAHCTDLKRKGWLHSTVEKELPLGPVETMVQFRSQPTLGCVLILLV
jgi:hypothetical protein